MLGYNYEKRGSMKQIFILLIFFTLSQASLDSINSFESDFTQTVTDEKNKTLTYKGYLIAQKPQNAMWSYTTPVVKDVYISSYNVTIVEPEIEQVIIRKIESNFDFFNMIKSAKKIRENVYIAIYKESEFTITKNGKLIESISYSDEFENKVKILFENQQQNKMIDKQLFIPKFSSDYDIIRD